MPADSPAAAPVTAPIRITTTTEALDRALDSRVRGTSDALFFQTAAYRRLLIRHLGRTSRVTDETIVAVDDAGQPVAGLPLLAATHPEHGTLLNALPFYGSNGGVVPLDAAGSVRRALLAAVHDVADRTGARATTIVASPFERDAAAYDAAFPGALPDERIGQLTPLPAQATAADDDARRDALMAACHQKTRNMIRKAWKSGVTVERDESADALDFLARTHADNLAAIGGIAKPRTFFEDVAAVLDAGRDWRITVARHAGVRVAALLTLHAGPTAEYFTPVVVRDARPLQPLSAIVLDSMVAAARDGHCWWNWGGTWLSQDGVYRFKSRWGTEDHRYRYWTVVHDDSLLDVPRAELASIWPGFYAYPWGAVDARRGDDAPGASDP